MNYQVLARKWRPRIFNDMVGQEHTVRILSNALVQKRIHHAYLFTGTRGVGKTTIARILAKCLNCETGITHMPCQQCQACLSIDKGQFLDLYEVDAASRTKVEDTRELLDNVLYPPNQGRYKIYLIDEVHMLSNHSFNALLKTLEEPPPHVKFLLATTDPKRLPITILSRCLQFHLKRIPVPQILSQLQYICEQESITYDANGLTQLAQAADGSMRDALSLLDQAIAYGQGHISEQEVCNMLGNVAETQIIPLLNALVDRNGAALFEHAKLLSDRAPDYNRVLETMISIFHHIALQQVVPGMRHHSDSINEFAQRITPEDVQLFYQIALLSRRDLALTPYIEQGFEMMLIRMLTLKPSLVTPSEAKLNDTDNSKKAVATLSVLSDITHNDADLGKEANLIAKTSAQEDQATPLEWRHVLSQLNLSGMALALASNCTLNRYDGNKVELALSANHQPMLNVKLKQRIAEALSKYLKQEITLEISITSEELFTPTKASEQEQQTKLQQAKETILADPKVQQLIEMYDATVEVSLVNS